MESYAITKAIFDRLKQDNIDGIIKETYWSNQQAKEPDAMRVVWKDRAKKGCQIPYAVFSVASDSLIEQSSGTGRTQSIDSRQVGPFTIAGQTIAPSEQTVQYRQMLIQFNCISTSDSRLKSSESWAVNLAELITNSLTNGKLCFQDNLNLIRLHQVPPIQLRDDDENWVIVAQFEIEYEFVVNEARLSASRT